MKGDRTPPEHDQTNARTGTRGAAQKELVESLIDQVAHMREKLAEEREARRRADTIIAQPSQANATLAQRVPELEAAPEPRESLRRPPRARRRVTTFPRSKQKPSQRRSWWRELLRVGVMSVEAERSKGLWRRLFGG